MIATRPQSCIHGTPVIELCADCKTRYAELVALLGPTDYKETNPTDLQFVAEVIFGIAPLEEAARTRDLTGMYFGAGRIVFVREGRINPQYWYTVTDGDTTEQWPLGRVARMVDSGVWC